MTVVLYISSSLYVLTMPTTAVDLERNVMCPLVQPTYYIESITAWSRKDVGGG